MPNLVLGLRWEVTIKALAYALRGLSGCFATVAAKNQMRFVLICTQL